MIAALLTANRDSQLTAGFVHRRQRTRGESSVHLSSDSSTAWMQPGALSRGSAVKWQGKPDGADATWAPIEFKRDVGPVGFEPTTGGLEPDNAASTDVSGGLIRIQIRALATALRPLMYSPASRVCCQMRAAPPW